MGDTVEKMFRFLRPYYPDTDIEIMKYGIEQYLKRGTYDYALDKNGELVAVALWELRNNNTVLHVKELVIRKDWWGKQMFKDFTTRALIKTPTLKRISFCRLRKYNDGKVRFYDINKFLWRHK